jgi:hypothetical protein
MPTDPLLLPFRITGVFLYKFTTDLSGGDETTLLAKYRYYLQPTLITGLGIPAPSIRTGDAYRMDGSYFSGLNIASRTVTITIPVIGDIQAKRAEIYNMFSQDPSLPLDTYYNLYLELDTGFTLVLHKVILDTMTDNIDRPRGQLLNISFFSADPWWYSVRMKSDIQSVAYAGPPDTPLTMSYDVQCLGTGIAYPKIIITGQSNRFQITNASTEQVIGPVYLSCAPGEVITIVTSPTESRGIFSSLHSPSDIINHVGGGGNLDFYLDWGFPHNHIMIDGVVTGGTVTVELQWYESYIGV